VGTLCSDLHPGLPLRTELHMHMQIHATYREVTNRFESCDLDTFSKFAKDFFPDGHTRLSFLLRLYGTTHRILKSHITTMHSFILLSLLSRR
jgi:hypothetical protein